MAKHRKKRKLSMTKSAIASRKYRRKLKRGHRPKKRGPRKHRNTNPFAFLAGFQSSSPTISAGRKRYGARAQERLARLRAHRYHSGAQGYGSGYAAWAAKKHYAGIASARAKAHRKAR